MPIADTGNPRVSSPAPLCADVSARTIVEKRGRPTGQAHTHREGARELDTLGTYRPVALQWSKAAEIS
jgi:hypothetical protein